jgi:hypothetical protein
MFPKESIATGTPLGMCVRRVRAASHLGVQLRDLAAPIG